MKDSFIIFSNGNWASDLCNNSPGIHTYMTKANMFM